MFDAKDSLGYHQLGSYLARDGIDNVSANLSGMGISDRGFPIYLFIIYSIFGDIIIIPRILNAIWGALTVMLIYRLAKRNFGEPTARIAAIMTMLMPNLVYYSGVHLKETVMVFLLVAFLERADYLIRYKLNYTVLVQVVLLGISMLYFRTVLLASVLFALFSMLMFVRSPGSNVLKRAILGFWVILIVWVTFSGRILAEFDYLLENVESQSNTMEYMARRESGNQLARYGSSFVFAPMILIAPFPTFVNIEHQKVHMLLSGAYFVKNVLAFFVIISLVSFVRKRKLRKHVLILSFMLSYLVILAQSRFALSERFHLPILPVFLILAAYGVTHIDYKNRKYFIPYLAVLAIIVLGWNWFKLAGRGMI